MRVFLIGLFSLSMIFFGCSSSESQDLDNVVKITPVTGYFSKRKPYKLEGYSLDKRLFNRYFSPAKVMGDSLFEIDFESNRVAAIIMPETPYDTRIILNKAYVTDSVLNVEYSIHEVLEKRSYKIVPVRLFTFDKDVEASHINFVYGDHTIKKPIR